MFHGYGSVKKVFFSFLCRTHTHMVYLSLNSFIQLFLPGFPAAKLICSYIYLLCMYTIIKFLTKSAIIFFLPFFNSKFSRYYSILLLYLFFYTGSVSYRNPCRNKHWSKCSLNTYIPIMLYLINEHKQILTWISKALFYQNIVIVQKYGTFRL